MKTRLMNEWRSIVIKNSEIELYCRICNRNNHDTADCSYKKQIHAVEINRKQSEIKCWFCGQLGHMEMNYPKKNLAATAVKLKNPHYARVDNVMYRKRKATTKINLTEETNSCSIKIHKT